MKTIKICPRCKSTDVKKEITIISIIGVPEQWVCNNCNFMGHIFPEVDIDDYKK